tara:strand:- start:2057 stop:2449 length:393 start_codon:yes stop_codon:yes gene_type:complete
MADSDAGMLVTSEPDKTYVQKPSKLTDSDKRDMIVNVLGVGANTAATLTGDNLERAYNEALNSAEKRNMGGTMRNMPGYMGGGMMPGYMDGGMMDETLGYTRGGMKEEKRGPIKYSKGGAIKGKNYKGSF